MLFFLRLPFLICFTVLHGAVHLLVLVCHLAMGAEHEMDFD
jgi:hypothetical protein